jgi:protein-tyrosine phosphatase
MLHPLRRRRAIAALRGRPRPRKVLVVCHGNICRSPVAGALLARELAPLGIDVRSAGFIGFDRPAPDEAMAAAQCHDVDLSSHRSRLVTGALVRATDLMVAMDPSQRRLLCERYGCRPSDVVILGDFDPDAVETRTIRDPIDEDREVFAAVYERIARCVREFAITLRNTST